APRSAGRSLINRLRLLVSKAPFDISKAWIGPIDTNSLPRRVFTTYSWSHATHSVDPTSGASHVAVHCQRPGRYVRNQVSIPFPRRPRAGVSLRSRGTRGPRLGERSLQEQLSVCE